MRRSLRTCIGCLARKKKDELVRLIVREESKMMVDPTGESYGRGAYLCQKKSKINKECLDQAVKREAFKRSFKKKVRFSNLSQ